MYEHQDCDLIMKLPDTRSRFKSRLLFPTDLQTVKSRFDEGYYTSAHLFLADMRRCFAGFRQHYGCDKNRKRIDSLKLLEAHYIIRALELNLVDSCAQTSY
ncbi:hypothetical protein ACOME3_009104 [Neoechinorhynchus agilis]